MKVLPPFGVSRHRAENPCCNLSELLLHDTPLRVLSGLVRDVQLSILRMLNKFM